MHRAKAWGRRLSRPETTRAVLVWLGIAALAAVWLSATARSLLLQPYVLSALIFTLVGLILVPARSWPLAFLVGSGGLAAARLATRLKEMAVSLPITYVDVASTLQEPEIVLHAIGIHAPVEWLMIGFGVVLAAIFLVAMWLAPRAALTRSAMLIVETAALIAVALPALARAGDFLSATVTTRFSYDALQSWEPGGQRLLMRNMGPLEYLAFTRAVGMQGWKAESHTTIRPIPMKATIEAAARYVSPSAARTLPNIVILHAESSFDPNLIFRLTKPVDSPLWTPASLTKSLGALRVNIVGGGTQVTQFELFTGADTRQFGYWGFYTHLTLAPKLRDAFPRYLAAKGYRTIASYPVNGDWLGAGEAFKDYGFQRVIFAKDMHLRGDWSETDTELVGRALERGALKPASEPFFTFLSTLENHGPHPCKHFTSRSQFVTSFEGNATFAQDCSLNEYLWRTRSTTAAMKMVIDSLLRAQETTGRPFVLLIYGDHQPWSFTDGDYTVAGGVANAHDTASFARFRRGPNQRITFYHLISSVPGTLPRGFATPVPVTLLPSLLSAYVANGLDDLYMPENFYTFDRCGADYRDANCRLSDDADAWALQRLFEQRQAGPGPGISRSQAR